MLDRRQIKNAAMLKPAKAKQRFQVKPVTVYDLLKPEQRYELIGLKKRLLDGIHRPSQS